MKNKAYLLYKETDNNGQFTVEGCYVAFDELQRTMKQLLKDGVGIRVDVIELIGVSK